MNIQNLEPFKTSCQQFDQYRTYPLQPFQVHNTDARHYLHKYCIVLGDADRKIQFTIGNDCLFANAHYKLEICELIFRPCCRTPSVPRLANHVFSPFRALGQQPTKRSSDLRKVLVDDSFSAGAPLRWCHHIIAPGTGLDSRNQTGPDL